MRTMFRGFGVALSAALVIAVTSPTVSAQQKLSQAQIDLMSSIVMEPERAGALTRDAVRRSPKEAPALVATAVSVAPQRSSAITSGAIEAAPGQAEAIREAAKKAARTPVGRRIEVERR